ncbi:Helix-turn-helix domain protein [Frankia canadensis]|uniref:Helix-turn-helix domain protein n=1 Tax=Frankia canadensis TaxID=1836972 RepID=A0A2I2KK79_9ACTN|nr:helix-turn-helix transcriptional regulator [Frankia canadensis]SNQ46065.1 Helix-turn-helix domain protein [Frankia canadensis]SOU53355.1 Helix-turn-helix domain protein [Frankia canadensis]
MTTPPAPAIPPASAPHTGPAARTGPETRAGGGRSGTRRRSELASFLRSRRERITPQDVGLPPGPRRRTPGLRREEVAQLAGVGITWYTWLEQGRPINASVQVLDAIARTLRLDAAEHQHPYRLADVGAPAGARTGEADDADADGMAGQDVRAILDSLDPLPAALVNARSDVLAWNQGYAALLPAVVGAPAERRNSLWVAFSTPRCCNPLRNIEEQAAEHVAILRYRYSQHLGEPGWQDFILRLCAASPFFARQWATHDVAPTRPCDKVFSYPGSGEIATRTTSLDLATRPGVRMLVYVPVDERSRARLGWLREHPEAAAPRHRH